MEQVEFVEPIKVKATFDGREYTLVEATRGLKGWENTLPSYRDREESIALYRKLVIAIEKQHAAREKRDEKASKSKS